MAVEITNFTLVAGANGELRLQIWEGSLKAPEHHSPEFACGADRRLGGRNGSNLNLQWVMPVTSLQ